MSMRFERLRHLARPLEHELEPLLGRQAEQEVELEL